MVGTLPSGCCLQGVRAEPQSPNETGHDMRVFAGMGKSIERNPRLRWHPTPNTSPRGAFTFDERCEFCQPTCCFCCFFCCCRGLVLWKVGSRGALLGWGSFPSCNLPTS